MRLGWVLVVGGVTAVSVAGSKSTVAQICDKILRSHPLASSCCAGLFVVGSRSPRATRTHEQRQS